MLRLGLVVLRLPAIGQFWGFSFIFVSFALSTPWFLMAIVLASIYDLYKEELKVRRIPSS